MDDQRALKVQMARQKLEKFRNKRKPEEIEKLDIVQFTSESQDLSPYQTDSLNNAEALSQVQLPVTNGAVNIPKSTIQDPISLGKSFLGGLYNAVNNINSIVETAISHPPVPPTIEPVKEEPSSTSISNDGFEIQPLFSTATTRTYTPFQNDRNVMLGSNFEEVIYTDQAFDNNNDGFDTHNTQDDSNLNSLQGNTYNNYLNPSENYNQYCDPPTHYDQQYAIDNNQYNYQYAQENQDYDTQGGNNGYNQEQQNPYEYYSNDPNTQNYDYTYSNEQYQYYQQSHPDVDPDNNNQGKDHIESDDQNLMTASPSNAAPPSDTVLKAILSTSPYISSKKTDKFSVQHSPVKSVNPNDKTDDWYSKLVGKIQDINVSGQQNNEFDSNITKAMFPPKDQLPTFNPDTITSIPLGVPLGLTLSPQISSNNKDYSPTRTSPSYLISTDSLIPEQFEPKSVFSSSSILFHPSNVEENVGFIETKVNGIKNQTEVPFVDHSVILESKERALRLEYEGKMNTIRQKEEELQQMEVKLRKKEHALSFFDQESSLIQSKSKSIDQEKQTLLQKERKLQDKDLELNQLQIQLRDLDNELLTKETSLKIEQEKVTRYQKELEMRDRSLVKHEQEVQAKLLRAEEQENRLAGERFAMEETLQQLDNKRTFIESEEKRIQFLSEKNNQERKSLHEFENNLVKQKTYLDQKEKSLHDTILALQAKAAKVEEKDKELKLKYSQMQAESKRLEAMSVEITKARNEVMVEKGPLLQLKAEVEEKQARITQVEDSIKDETRRLEEQQSVIKKKEDYCRKIESEILSREADVRNKYKQFEEEKQLFESHQSTYEKEKAFLTERGLKIENSLDELKQKQKSIHEDQIRQQKSAATNERGRLELERDRSTLLEREAELRRRMEMSIPANSEGQNLVLFKQQLEVDRHTLEKERRDLLQKQMELRRHEDDFGNRASALKQEASKINDLSRQLSFDKSNLQRKEAQMSSLIEDCARKQKELHETKSALELEKKRLEAEKIKIDSEAVRLGDEKKKLRDILEMKAQGSDFEALKGLILEDYLSAVREKDVLIRELQDNHTKKVRTLEDEIFSLRKVSSNQKDILQNPRPEDFDQDYNNINTSFGGLSQDQVKIMNDLAMKQINTADLKDMISNKDKYDLLNMIVALTNANQNLSQKLEKSSSQLFDGRSILNSRRQESTPVMSSIRPTSAFGYQKHPHPHRAHQTPSEYQSDYQSIYNRMDPIPDELEFSTISHRSSVGGYSDAGREPRFQQHQVHTPADPKVIVSALREKLERSRYPSSNNRIVDASRIRRPPTREGKIQNILRNNTTTASADNSNQKLKSYFSAKDMDGLSDTTKNMLFGERSNYDNSNGF